MKKILALPIALGAVMVLSTPLFAQNSEESREKSVAMSQVPQAAKDAAKQALGADPTEAKIIRGTRPQQYELEAEGTNGGPEKAVHVTSDGKVVKTETENESQERHERR